MRLAIGIVVLLILGLAGAARTTADEPAAKEMRFSDTRSAVVIPLEYTLVDDLLPVLHALLDGDETLPLRIGGDWRTNAVLAVGCPAALSGVRALVSRLDVPVFHVHARSPAHILELERIDAAETADMLTELVRAAPSLWRFTRRGPPPSVVAQTEDNRLILQGDDVAADLLLELAERLDEAREDSPKTADPGEPVRTAALPLEWTLVDEVVPVLRELYPLDDGDALRFTGDSRSNTLHVAGLSTLVEQVRESVRHLDIHVCFTTARYPVKLVTLERADPVETAALLTRLITAAPDRWRDSSEAPPVTVVADAAGARLLIQGQSVASALIMDLIRELDAPATVAPEEEQ